MDFTLYWFMFPISICVATTAMLSGIGGAAMFTPIFLILFPLLGPEYALADAAAAIGVALFTETFGFSSGFVAYFRRGLIDFKSAIPFLGVAVPIAIGGALVSHLVNQNVLKAAYAILMMVIAFIMLRHHTAKPETVPGAGPENSTVGAAAYRETRTIVARNGKVYTFNVPRQGKAAAATASGGFLTGLLSVGIGEVMMPQLVKRNNVPIPVAAATSVFVVIITVAAASFTHVSALIAQGGWGAVPWELVAYTAPAVVIGGQIGPFLQGRISHRIMERFIGVLFATIGIAMLGVVFVALR